MPEGCTITRILPMARRMGVYRLCPQTAGAYADARRWVNHVMQEYWYSSVRRSAYAPMADDSLFSTIRTGRALSAPRPSTCSRRRRFLSARV